MKIKNSNDNLKLGNLIPLVYGSALVLIVLRCLQLAKYIDSETGFLTGGGFVNFAFYAVMAVACIGFVAVSFLSAQGRNVELVALKDKNAAIGCTVFAVSLIYDFLDSFIEGIVIYNDMPIESYGNIGEFAKALMATGALPYALQALFALLSAVYVIVLAKSFFAGSNAAHNKKFIAVAPVAWASFKLITRFIKQISYIKVSDLFLELIMISFMILFFVALSQVVSGVYSDDSRWRITALGFSSALLSFVISVPRLVFTLFADEFVNKEYPFSLDDAMFGIFALFIALAAVKSVKKAGLSEE